jgi:hypothetical protein
MASVSPPFGSGGDDTLARGEGVGGRGPNSDDGTDTVLLYVVYIYVLCGRNDRKNRYCIHVGLGRIKKYAVAKS